MQGETGCSLPAAPHAAQPNPIANGHGPQQPPAQAPAAPAGGKGQVGPPVAVDAAPGSPPNAVPASIADGEANPSAAPAAEGTNNDAVSSEDIQLVQNLIERCLQLYMTRDEVVNILNEQATIDPGFTRLVWTKLEEQNPDFFRCYYTRLKLKAQIIMFNHLLEQQVEVVQKMQRGWGGGAPASATASGIPLFQGNSAGGSGKGFATASGGGMHDASRQQAHRGGSGQPGQDREVPGDGTSDYNFNSAHALDAPGPSPLFNGLNMGSDHDLAAFGNSMPPSGELQSSLFPPTTSPLTLPSEAAGAGGRSGMPRNFSLSDLHDDLDLQGLDRTGSGAAGGGTVG